ncbi:hypothetical protein ACQPT2_08710 [Erwinia amylovora]
MNNHRIPDILFTEAEEESSPRALFQKGTGIVLERKDLIWQ